MVKAIPEQALIASFKRGEESALAYYYRLHFRTLIYYSQRVTGDRQEAEDIVADIFAKLWKMRENFHTSSGIRAFLYISVRNASLNYLGYLKRQSAVKDDLQYISDAAEDAPDFTAFEVEAAVLQQVHDEIENLPRRCKEIFKLSYFGGMSNDEIAEKLELSPYTIANQKQRAITLLKTSLLKRPLLKVLVLSNLLLTFCLQVFRVGKV